MKGNKKKTETDENLKMKFRREEKRTERERESGYLEIEEPGLPMSLIG